MDSLTQPQRIFLSYAHRDGRALAARLRTDLEGLGFEVWLDTNRLTAGDTWAREIEAAIDKCDLTLALLSTASYESDICRAEPERSLAKQKPVIPIRLQTTCEVPLVLQTRQYIDFSDADEYDVSLRHLEDSVRNRRGITAANAIRTAYNNSPPLPQNFIDRPAILASLRDALFAEAANRNIAVTAIKGMGGIGKSVLARALCQLEVVRHAYPDGIFWLTIGRESGVGFCQYIEQVPGLKLLLGPYNTDDACVSQYRNAFRTKAVLIVLDDVWRVQDIEPFLTESPRSRLLITTRDAGIAPALGAREFVAELPTGNEASEMLARWADLDPKTLSAQAREVIERCQSLPLGLAMIGAHLKGKSVAHWGVVLDHLRNANLSSIRARFPEPHTSLMRAMHVSFEALREEYPVSAERYLRLAVLSEDLTITGPIQQTLWNANEREALETSDRLVGLSMAQHDGTSGGIILHDLQMDYVRTVNADPRTLDLIRQAVRLSAPVIQKDPFQFVSQVVGRLLPHQDSPSVGRFIADISAGAPRPWLRPLNWALHPAGTSLLRTIADTGFPASASSEREQSINSIAITPDGKCILSASSDTNLRLWSLETGRLLRTFRGHSGSVEGVTLTLNGNRALTAGRDCTVRMWDVHTGELIRTLMGHAEAVNGVAASPDGKRAISASSDHTLKVWDLDTGMELHTLKGHDGKVSSVVLTPDGKLAVSASEDTRLMVWDVETGRLMRTLEGHSRDVRSLAVTRDGRRAISTSWDHTVRLWDLIRGELLSVSEDRSSLLSNARGIAVLPDGKRAIIASSDHMFIFDLQKGLGSEVLQGPSSEVTDLAITPDGRTVVSSAEDGTLKVWNLEGQQIPPEGHDEAITGIAVTPDGEKIVSSSWDFTLGVWDLAQHKLLRLLGHLSMVTSVTVTPNGKCAISGGWDHSLRIWDLQTGRIRLTIGARSGKILSVAALPDGRRFLSSGQDHALKIWGLRSLRMRFLGRPLYVLEGHRDVINDIAVTTDGKRALSASQDTTLRLWDLQARHTLLTLEGHLEPVVSVAFTPDARCAVSASYERNLRVWDLETGQTIRMLEGHTDGVKSVAIMPDGKRVISASLDRTVRVWDLDSGSPHSVFYCDAPVFSCAVVNNTCIAAGDRGGRLYILALEKQHSV